MSENPYQTNATPEPIAGPPVEQIKPKVFPPAIALIVSGALSTMGGLWGIISWILARAGVYPTPQQKQAQTDQLRQAFADNPQIGDFFIQMQDFQGSIISLMLNLVGFVFAIIVIFGGIKLMNLRAYGLVLAAAIINMIPLFTCCCYGLPIGIWVLVTLMSGDVKAAFRQTA